MAASTLIYVSHHHETGVTQKTFRVVLHETRYAEFMKLLSEGMQIKEPKIPVLADLVKKDAKLAEAKVIKNLLAKKKELHFKVMGQKNSQVEQLTAMENKRVVTEKDYTPRTRPRTPLLRLLPSEFHFKSRVYGAQIREFDTELERLRCQAAMMAFQGAFLNNVHRLETAFGQTAFQIPKYFRKLVSASVHGRALHSFTWLVEKVDVEKKWIRDHLQSEAYRKTMVYDSREGQVKSKMCAEQVVSESDVDSFAEKKGIYIPWEECLTIAMEDRCHLTTQHILKTYFERHQGGAEVLPLWMSSTLVIEGLLWAIQDLHVQQVNVILEGIPNVVQLIQDNASVASVMTTVCRYDALESFKVLRQYRFPFINLEGCAMQKGAIGNGILALLITEFKHDGGALFDSVFNQVYNLAVHKRQQHRLEFLQSQMDLSKYRQEFIARDFQKAHEETRTVTIKKRFECEFSLNNFEWIEFLCSCVYYDVQVEISLPPIKKESEEMEITKMIYVREICPYVFNTAQQMEHLSRYFKQWSFNRESPDEEAPRLLSLALLFGFIHFEVLTEWIMQDNQLLFVERSSFITESYQHFLWVFTLNCSSLHQVLLTTTGIPMVLCEIIWNYVGGINVSQNRTFSTGLLSDLARYKQLKKKFAQFFRQHKLLEVDALGLKLQEMEAKKQREEEQKRKTQIREQLESFDLGITNYGQFEGNDEHQ